MNSDIPDSATWPDAKGSYSYDTAPVVVAELAPEPPEEVRPVPLVLRRRWKVPLLLFVLTCASTFHVGGMYFAVPLMTILVCHEMGHFLQAKRYGVPASFPFFIPMPFSQIGTMGAVIGMSSNTGDRRALFDIGITGPLAGLVPTLIFLVVGLWWSHVQVAPPHAFQFGEPLLLRFLVWLKFGSVPAGMDVLLHPMAYAAWVGLLITSLNLIPIGQLDGGHVLYALLREKAHRVAEFLLNAAAVAVVVGTVFYDVSYSVWILMVLLLFVMGPIHPPTANDDAPLGTARIVLGWLTLAFIFIGFTPTPFKL